MTVKLAWANRVIGTGINVYRSETAFTAATLPAVLASIAADATFYSDDTVVADTTYFYAVGIVDGARIALSSVVEILAEAGGEPPVVIAGFKGARLSQSVDTAYAYNGTTPVAWDTVDYDTDGFYSAGSPSKFVIPAGVSRVRVFATVRAGYSETTGTIILAIAKNGSANYYGAGYVSISTTAVPSGWGLNGAEVATADIAVVAGDEFELIGAKRNYGAAFDLVEKNNSCFAIEVIE